MKYLKPLKSGHLLVHKLAPEYKGQGRTEERPATPVGGRFNMALKLLMRLVSNACKMSRSPGSPTRILKDSREALMGSVTNSGQTTFTPHCSFQAASLKMVLSVGTVGGVYRWGRSSEWPDYTTSNTFFRHHCISLTAFRRGLGGSFNSLWFKEHIADLAVTSSTNSNNSKSDHVLISRNVPGTVPCAFNALSHFSSQQPYELCSIL